MFDNISLPSTQIFRFLYVICRITFISRKLLGIWLSWSSRGRVEITIGTQKKEVFLGADVINRGCHDIVCWLHASCWSPCESRAPYISREKSKILSHRTRTNLQNCVLPTVTTMNPPAPSESVSHWLWIIWFSVWYPEVWKAVKSLKNHWSQSSVYALSNLHGNTVQRVKIKF